MLPFSFPFSLQISSPLLILSCFLPQQRGERVAAGVAGAAGLCSVSPAGAEHSGYSEVQRNVHSGEPVNTAVARPLPQGVHRGTEQLYD